MTRLVRFTHREKDGVGRLEGRRIYPLLGVRSINDVLETAPARIARMPLSSADGLDIGDVHLSAPIDPVRNVMCVGWNYLAHFEEGRSSRPDVELPEHPAFFTKATTTVTGPYDPIPTHSSITKALEWEVELAVVIGREGRDIPEAEALSFVYGYTVANDVSAREVQRSHGGQWFKGKSLDGTCPVGPLLVTADEISEPQGLQLTCRVNGTIVQQASTALMIFPVARIIAELSAGLTLLPGDLIITGTPERIDQSPGRLKHLRSGDVLESEITHIGVMRNQLC